MFACRGYYFQVEDLFEHYYYYYYYYYLFIFRFQLEVFFGIQLRLPTILPSPYPILWDLGFVVVVVVVIFIS